MTNVANAKMTEEQQKLVDEIMKRENRQLKVDKIIREAMVTTEANVGKKDGG